VNCTAGNYFFLKVSKRHLTSGPQMTVRTSIQPNQPIHIGITYPVHNTLRGKGCERSEQLGDKSVLNIFCSLHSMACTRRRGSNHYCLWDLLSKIEWVLIENSIFDKNDLDRFLPVVQTHSCWVLCAYVQKPKTVFVQLSSTRTPLKSPRKPWRK